MVKTDCIIRMNVFKVIVIIIDLLTYKLIECVYTYDLMIL